MKQTKQSVGYAGEYAVAYELCRRGFLCALTPTNAQHVDILAVKGKKQKQIQVKCNQYGKPDWLISKSALGLIHEDCYFVFVILKGLNERPDFYVVRSKEVAEFANRHHAEWLAGLGDRKTEKSDGTMRRYRDLKGQWKERWDLLDDVW